MMSTKLVARWMARGGKQYLDLYQQETDGVVTSFTIAGNGLGGNLGYFPTIALAIQSLEKTTLRAMKSDFPSMRRIEFYDIGNESDCMRCDETFIGTGEYCPKCAKNINRLNIGGK